METNNETVEQVLERMTSGMGRYCSIECQLLESDVVEYADRILTAHNRELAAKDAEIVKLRALVGELADALLAACDDTCDYCKKHLNIGDASALICLHNRQCNVGQAYGRLVAKAREVVK